MELKEIFVLMQRQKLLCSSQNELKQGSWSPQRFILEIEKSGLITSVNFYPQRMEAMRKKISP